MRLFLIILDEIVKLDKSRVVSPRLTPFPLFPYTDGKQGKFMLLNKFITIARPIHTHRLY